MNETTLWGLLVDNTTSILAASSNNTTTTEITTDDVNTNTSSSSSSPLTSQVDLEPTLEESLLLLTKEERAYAEEILLVIRYVIYVFSLPATVCNVLVFMQPSMRSATSFYVSGLSMAQLVYIGASVVGRVMATNIENPSNDITYLIYSVYVSSYLSIVVRRASYMLMCFMSLERLYAVVRPLHIKEFLLTRHPLVITGLTYLFALAWHVYMLAKSGIKEIRSSRTGKMVHIFVYTDLYKSNPGIADGFSTASPILMTYIPLVALMMLNVLTVWALRRHNTKLGKSSTNEEAKRQRERQMTRTILATTVIYILLSLPYAFHNLLKSIFEDFDKRQKYENLYYVSRGTAFNLTLLSCALDFFCFFLLSSNFRKTFLTLIRWEKFKGEKQLVSEASGSVTACTDVEGRY
ncbi:hypothetical protein ACOMHN_032195 [Nucella lapillus]